MRTLREIMTDNTITTTKESSLFEVAEMMKKHDVGIIPVVEGKKLVGVITDRDMVIRGMAEKRTESASVYEVMSTDVVSASPDMTVDEAAQLMAKEQIRRLPIVENGELVGIVAIGDLAVRKDSEEEAGEALSQISEPSRS